MGHLSMVNWDCFNSLKLGSYLSMQIKIKLEIKEANIYQELG
jgi:hypothetical protein